MCVLCGFHVCVSHVCFTCVFHMGVLCVSHVCFVWDLCEFHVYLMSEKVSEYQYERILLTSQMKSTGTDLY